MQKLTVEDFTVLCSYRSHAGICLPPFRDSLSVPSERVQQTWP